MIPEMDPRSVAMREHWKQWAASNLTYQRAIVVNGPCSLTVMTNDGHYKRKPAIGEETLIPIGFYYGKKGDAIMMLDPHAGSGFNPFDSAVHHVEVMIKDADKYVSNLTAFWKSFEAVVEDADLSEAARVGQAVEDLEYAKAVAMSDPRFGSW